MNEYTLTSEERTAADKMLADAQTAEDNAKSLRAQAAGGLRFIATVHGIEGQCTYESGVLKPCKTPSTP